MKHLLLHPKTALQLEHVISRPPQGLLVTGEIGSGKDTVSEGLAAELLGTNPSALTSHPFALIIDPDGDSVSIDDIRALQQFLKLKVPTKESRAINRAVLIKRAERMRSEAQNALLKILEEPPAHTMIILTAAAPERLLSTITSRCQQLALLPVSLDGAKDYFSDKGVSAAQLASAHALSIGQAGLLTALLTNSEHPLKEQVSQAKALLSEPVGKRLYRIDALAKQKSDIGLLLDALRRIVHAGLLAASRQNKTSAVEQWNKRATAILHARADLDRNANTKLLLTDLFLHI